MNSIFRVVLWVVVSILVTASLFPLFGYELAISQLEIKRVIEVPGDFGYLLVVRSSSFATLAFFGVNYLRRKRPLSSVEPLLVFSVFTVLFGSLTMFVGDAPYGWTELCTLGLVMVLSVFFFRQNKAESKTIFKGDDW